jgi:outer membrane protein
MKFKFIFSMTIVLSGTMSFAQELTLDSCRSLALLNSEALKIQKNETRKHESDLRAVRASMLPSINGSVLGFRVGETLNDFLPESGLNAGVSISQAIYAGGYYRSLVNQRKISTQMSGYGDTLRMQNIVVHVDKLFWSLVNAEENKRVSSSSLVIVNDIEKEIVAATKAGLMDQHEILKIQVKKTNAEIFLLQARSNARIIKYELSQVIGVDSSQWSLKVNWTNIESFDPDLVSRGFSVSENYILRLEKKSRELESANQSLMRSQFLPKLGVSFSSLYANISAGEAFQKKDFVSWYGTINLSIPIFQWHQRKHAMERAALTVQQKDYSIEQTRKSVELNFVKLSNAWNESYELYAASVKASKQAEEHFRIVKIRFDAGLVKSQDLLDASSELVQSQTSMIKARTEFEIYRTEYERITNRLTIH